MDGVVVGGGWGRVFGEVLEAGEWAGELVREIFPGMISPSCSGFRLLISSWGRGGGVSEIRERGGVNFYWTGKERRSF